MKKVFAIIVSLFFYQLLFSQTHRKQVTAFDVLYQEFSDSCHLSKMIIDEKRQLFFLGTNKGLFCFDEDKQIYHLNKINNIPFSISSFFLAKDKLWCGTANGFVFSLDLSVSPFVTQKYPSLNELKTKQDIKIQAILSIMLDETHIYAGTNEGLIISYEMNDTLKQTIHTQIPNNSLANGNVHNIELALLDRKQQSEMLIALADGLYYLKQQVWHLVALPNPQFIPKKDLRQNSRKSIFTFFTVHKMIKHQGKIWGIGKGSLKKEAQENVIFSLENSEDKKNMSSMIYMPSCIAKKNQVELNDFQFDNVGNIWIATENGLIIYDNMTDNCEQYTKETDSLFSIKQVERIFIKNDSTAYLLGVADEEKGFEIFEMQIGNLPEKSQTGPKDSFITLNKNNADLPENEVQILEKKEDIDCNRLLKLENLVFASSQSTFVNYLLAKKDLGLLSAYLIQNSSRKVEIEAHTSVVKNEKKEAEITEKRLDRVYNELLKNGVSKKQITTIAKGDKELLIKEPNNPAEHQQNRRVMAKIVCK